MRVCLDGEQRWCVEIVEGDGADAVPVRPDPESITVSPDGRSLAFASYSLNTTHDSDIWLLDLETQEYRGLTADGYSGVLDNATLPEGVAQDRAPAWLPDGTLTFARQQPPFDGLPALWAAALDGSAPEKLGDLAGVPGRRNTVLSMDWSDDGIWLAYILEGEPNESGGLWLYDAVEDESRLLFIPPEAPLRADFSPDGMSILLLTLARDTMRTPEEADLRLYMIDVQAAALSRCGGRAWSGLPDGCRMSGAVHRRGTSADESGGLFRRHLVRTRPDWPIAPRSDRPLVARYRRPPAGGRSR